jgi:GNAT superfamily N-acetyltransferase
MLAARFRPLTPARLAGIEDPCRGCGFPQLPASTGRHTQDAPTDNGHRPDGSELARQVTDRWGLCGVTAQLNGDVVGYLSFAPADLVAPGSQPGIGGATAESFSPNAAVVIALEVCRQHRRHGLGRNLVRSAVAQLARRQIDQVEAIGTFGRARISPAAGTARPSMILLPVDFWQAAGFRIVRPHPSTPTLRLDVSRTARWLPDLAAGWRRFADLVSQPPAQPASFEHRRELAGEQVTEPS